MTVYMDFGQDPSPMHLIGISHQRMLSDRFLLHMFCHWFHNLHSQGQFVVVNFSSISFVSYSKNFKLWLDFETFLARFSFQYDDMEQRFKRLALNKRIVRRQLTSSINSRSKGVMLGISVLEPTPRRPRRVHSIL